jgi:hypothetical protein
VATATDLVSTLLGKEPDSPELVSVLLSAAEQRLRRRIPTFDDRLVTEDYFSETVTFVEASAVVRVLKNPDGYRSESVGGINYTMDTRAAAGFLLILDDEWELLGASAGGGFSIAPYLPPRTHPDYWGVEPGWSPWC